MMFSLQCPISAGYLKTSNCLFVTYILNYLNVQFPYISTAVNKTSVIEKTLAAFLKCVYSYIFFPLIDIRLQADSWLAFSKS